MTEEELKEALEGRLRCVHASAGHYRYCRNEANTGGRGAGYMASRKGGLCRLASDVARGTTCSSCGFACGRRHGELRRRRDDGELRKALAEACAGWTPPPATTNRIPGEAEP